MTRVASRLGIPLVFLAVWEVAAQPFLEQVDDPQPINGCSNREIDWSREVALLKGMLFGALTSPSH